MFSSYKVIKVDSEVKPSKRAHFGFCCGGNSVWIFGGHIIMDSDENKPEFYNDLWCFNGIYYFVFKNIYE